MGFANKLIDGGHLLLFPGELEELKLTGMQKDHFVRRLYARLSLFIGWSLESVTLANLDCKNKVDLTGCTEAIFLATMPDNLRVIHKCNDQVTERIYIGRRFKNDIERLEKLSELYM